MSVQNVDTALPAPVHSIPKINMCHCDFHSPQRHVKKITADRMSTAPCGSMQSASSPESSQILAEKITTGSPSLRVYFKQYSLFIYFIPYY